jgi:DMSO/TMAO reductase YedYZ molybdopterin-dependent catalytic subunit
MFANRLPDCTRYAAFRTFALRLKTGLNQMSEIILRIDGLVKTPLEFSFEDLQSLPDEFQIPDVGRLNPKRPGTGVTLRGLLTLAEPQPESFWLTFHATLDDFAASIPADPSIIETGVIVYALEGAPLPTGKGGPTRFLIPDPATCHTAELDECANVKFLDRIEITPGRGRDTRPESEEDHAELHRNEGEHQS